MVRKDVEMTVIWPREAFYSIALSRTSNREQNLDINFANDLWTTNVLCIVQDNLHDKTSEIAKMPYIFSNAIFTITATRSRSIHDGFLHHWAVDPGAVAFRIPYRCHDNLVGSITLLDIHVSSEPIDERCWTYKNDSFRRESSSWLKTDEMVLSRGRHNTRRYRWLER